MPTTLPAPTIVTPLQSQQHSLLTAAAPQCSSALTPALAQSTVPVMNASTAASQQSVAVLTTANALIAPAQPAANQMSSNDSPTALPQIPVAPKPQTRYTTPTTVVYGVAVSSRPSPRNTSDIQPAFPLVGSRDQGLFQEKEDASLFSPDRVSCPRSAEVPILARSTTRAV